MTGVVTLNTDSTSVLIPDVYVLEVVASDLGDPPLKTEPRAFSVIVTDYNDEAPVFVHPELGDTVYVDEVIHDYRYLFICPRNYLPVSQYLSWARYANGVKSI